MRVAIAHSVMREAKILERVIAAEPGQEVAWVAGTGAEAIDKAAADPPDVLLVDLLLSGAQGAEVTRLIMRTYPCAILIVTPSAARDAARVFEAMGNGALDVVSVPVRDEKGHIKGKDQLLKKLAMIEKLIRREEVRMNGQSTHMGSPIPPRPLVAIGSSTGGPKALAALLSGLPADLGASVVVVQHLDVQFADGLAEWLDGQTPLKVVLAKEDMRVDDNTVYVAGTNDHLIVGPELAFHYVIEPKDYPYRPSVDRFFISARDWWREKGVAVLLTGMGKDGAKGLLTLRDAGWHTIAQDEATSVVYGMPKAAADIGAAREILGVEKIAASVVTHIKANKGIVSDERK
ncbi:MAG TPA: chemotaxis-specific protein-glutamate methyltransferase CheB [Syntrophorhabdaceae bacterium]|jgi:two-component system response regulator WspF